MAELALLASIVQIADTGYRLSLKLYTSGEAISSADRTIITISKDISLTSTVLKELGEILRRDQEEKERICSENLIQTAGNTVKECLDAFEELDKMILKNMPNLSQGHRATRATMALEKLKWPFIQPRVQLLRGSLDMLRANISLMLNVLIYARHVSDRLVSRHIARYSRCLIKKFYSQAFRKKLRAPAPDVYDEARQKTIIEELVNAKDEYVRKFESLKLSIPASPLTQTVHNIGSRAAPAPTEGTVVPTQHKFNTLPATTFQYAPTPPFNPSSVNNFQNAPAPPFNPSSANTFQNAPAPQHTSNTFSANTFQNTPAPQWPLPNIPASYPIMPKDPVAVQSDQYNSWPLLHHLNTLVASLIREVYSPEHQIPVESRSRFTGAIRETHTTEIVEAESRERSKYAECAILEPDSVQSPTTPPESGLQLGGEYPIATRRQSRAMYLSMANQGPSLPSSPKPHPRLLISALPGAFMSPNVPYMRTVDQKDKHEDVYRNRMQRRKTRREFEDEEQSTSKRAKVNRMRRMGSGPSSLFSRDEDVPTQTDQALEDQPWCNELPEPERNDVVDDLVKLWTLVR